MKIIVAQSTAGTLPSAIFYRESICAILEAAGHKTQLLDLPSIAAPSRALTNIASLRLLETALTADALICLDAVAAVLRHPRKMVVMLDDAYLASDRVQLPHEKAAERRFIANILRGALGEADQIFTLSRFALDSLRALSLDRTSLLQPEVALPPTVHARHQGPELLALNPLDDRQRPDLLIACLARLPEPFRARWISPQASPTLVANLRQLALDAGVEQRLAIDVRRVNAGEKAYLLAHAAALVELAPGSLAVSDSARQAIHIGVPVITCEDGGALLELVGPESPPPAQTNPASVATAVRASCDAPARIPPSRTSRAQPRTTGWAPLLKALTQ